MADLTIEEQIERAAGKPRSHATDGLASEAQPIPDLIAADEYLTRKAEAERVAESGGSMWSGLNYAQFGPPGTSGASGPRRMRRFFRYF